MKYYLRWGFALCFIAPGAFAQTDSLALSNAKIFFVNRADESKSGEVDGMRQSGVHATDNFLDDEEDIWTSPFHMNWEDGLKWGGLATTTVLLITVDEPVAQDLFKFRNDNLWVQKVSPVATQFGQFYIPYGIAGLYCLAGLAFDDQQDLDTGLLATEAMVHTGIVVQVLKHTFGRSRPFVFNGEDNWYGPKVFFKRYYHGGFSPYDSFPSGHTITAFSLATVLAERERPWVGVVAYSCAGLCGISRVTQHDHWFSDVFVGAALGVAIGKMVVVNYHNRVTIYPSLGPNSAGVSMRVSEL